jgi:hypothetical protein
LPTARGGFTLVETGGRLYAIGGYQDHAYFDTVEIYDPATDSWSAGAPMPTPRGFAAGAAMDGVIYVFGGLGDAPGSSVAVEAYDPATDTWSRRHPLPDTYGTVMGAAATAAGIYVAGGDQGGATVPALRLYDPASDSWTYRADMPETPGWPDLDTLHAHLVVLGTTSGSAGAYLLSYAPTTDRWSSLPLPPQNSSQSVALGDFLYLTGQPVTGSGMILAIYDPATGETRAGAAIQPTLIPYRTAVLNGLIYAVGGLEDAGGALVETTRVEVYRP